MRPSAAISSPLAGDVMLATSSEGVTVVFDGSKSTAEAGGEIAKYQWRVHGPGDRRRVTQGPTASFKLPPGPYTARLAITTRTGQSSSDTLSFKVSGPTEPGGGAAAATPGGVTSTPVIQPVVPPVVGPVGPVGPATQQPVVPPPLTAPVVSSPAVSVLPGAAQTPGE